VTGAGTRRRDRLGSAGPSGVQGHQAQDGSSDDRRDEQEGGSHPDLVGQRTERERGGA
jgi:hypothetical protein